jgi:hypothetical protein
MINEAQDRLNVADEEDPEIKALIVTLNKGEEGVKKTIEEFIEGRKKELDNMEILRSEFVKELPKKYSTEIAESLSSGRLILTQMANASLLEQEQGRLLDPVKKNLEVARELRTTIEHLQQGKKDAHSKRDGR